MNYLPANRAVLKRTSNIHSSYKLSTVLVSGIELVILTMTTSTTAKKNTIEAAESWENHQKRLNVPQSSTSNLKHDDSTSNSGSFRRKLNHAVDDDNKIKIKILEAEMEDRYHQKLATKAKIADKKKKHKGKKRRKRTEEIYANPGIQEETVHGMMIDAGSTGSRMHVYEFNPRTLERVEDVQLAVSGRKLSYPGTDSRWTDRLRPGIGSFADIEDDEEMQDTIREYLKPLIDFARTVLHAKQDKFQSYPIFFRATAGMRVLEPTKRSRLMKIVRNLLSNTTFSPFWFEEERARVISGEEEGIFGWAAVNFLQGTLLEDSEGAGAVQNPKLTFGALDLGGASAQISFYEPDGDIMSNLFKFQIGQGKHWNLYTHSFLHFGMNAATDRFISHVVSGASARERLASGIYNPCLPGGSKKDVRSNTYLNNDGFEYHNSSYYGAMLINSRNKGDFVGCMGAVEELLHLELNQFCEFSHHGDCSLAGIYQPHLPTQENRHGEFLGFSNYYHVWTFLGLEPRSSIGQLKTRTEYVCSMSAEELAVFNNGTIADDEVDEYCFRSVYVYQLLKNGYRFHDEDFITATNVINGHKVSWAIGAMMYEINTLPWTYEQNSHRFGSNIGVTGKWENTPSQNVVNCVFFLTVLGVVFSSLFFTLRLRQRGRKDRHLYEQIQGDIQC